MGVVSLTNVKVHAHIGVLPEENAAGRWFSVSVHIHYPLKDAGKSNQVADTVDYKRVADAIQAGMKPKHKLLEAAARTVAEDILGLYPAIQKMEIHIRKMQPFIGGQVEAAEIVWMYPDDF
jgi:dihydroneopterin aldolase